MSLIVWKRASFFIPSKSSHIDFYVCLFWSFLMQYCPPFPTNFDVYFQLLNVISFATPFINSFAIFCIFTRSSKQVLFNNKVLKSYHKIFAPTIWIYSKNLVVTPICYLDQIIMASMASVIAISKLLFPVSAWYSNLNF